MNYFDYYNITPDTFGEFFKHLESRELLKLNGVCKSWKEKLDHSLFNFFIDAHHKIWQELPVISQFQNTRQIFNYRVEYTQLKAKLTIIANSNDTSKKMLTINDIQYIVDNILEIRKHIFVERTFDDTFSFWLQIFYKAYHANNPLEKYYAAREMQLSLEASGEPNSLTVLGVKLFNKLTDWENIIDESEEKFKTKKVDWDIIQHLFLNRCEFKDLVLSYSELEQANPLLLYTAIRCGFHAILDVFLETHSKELIDNASDYMLDAASNPQLDMLSKMLAHSPPLACSSTRYSILHALCLLREEEVELHQWQTCVEKLVQRGCSVFQHNIHNLTPLHLTINYQTLGFLEFLLKISAPLSIELCENLINYTNAMEILENYEEEARQVQSQILTLLIKSHVALIEKGEKQTLFHQAIEQRNENQFELLLKLAPFLSELALKNLKDYFIESVEEKGPLDIMTEDEEYTSEIQILKLLLNAYPSLIDDFNFTPSIYYYPWRLSAFIAHDTQHKQIYLQKLLLAVLKIPIQFIQNLPPDNLDDGSKFLHQQINFSVQLLHRQMNQILSAGLDLNQLDQQLNLENVLFLWQKKIKQTIDEEIQDRDLANSLFSIYQSSYSILLNNFKSFLTANLDQPRKRRRLNN